MVFLSTDLIRGGGGVDFGNLYPLKINTTGTIKYSFNMVLI